MSHGYVPVVWNQNKKVYDRVLLVGVLLFIVVDFALIQTGAPAGRTADEMTSLIRVFADAAFTLLNIILITGPLARLSDRFLPVLYNRRHMGVTMFMLALVHGALSLVWYHGFGPVDPFTSLFSGPGSFEAVTDFPFQPLGFFALVILLLMAATSHDYWNANLGAPVWKALHMGVYGAYALIILHIALGPLQSSYSGFPAWVAYGSVLLVGSMHLLGALTSGAEGKRAHAADADWVAVGSWRDIGVNKAKIIVVGAGERVAVFRNDANEVGAIGNACQHQNGPLGEGCIKDGFVTCPWHGFQYDLKNGRSPAPFTEKVPTYTMKAEGDQLFLDPTPLPDGTERPLLKFAPEGEVA